MIALKSGNWENWEEKETWNSLFSLADRSVTRREPSKGQKYSKTEYLRLFTGGQDRSARRKGNMSQRGGEADRGQKGREEVIS